MSGEDHAELMPVFGSGVSPGDSVLMVGVGVEDYCNVEIMLTA